MTEQTDAANLAATGNTGAAAAQSGAAGADPAAKTLDTASGGLPKPTPVDPANKPNPAPGSTTHVDNLKDKPAPQKAQPGDEHIDPKTGKTFGSERVAAQAQSKVAVEPGLSTSAGVLAQHEKVNAENEKRNAANEEGHAVNMEREAKLAQDAADRTEKAPAPTTGKQRDENTPTVLKDGTKVWKA